MKNQIYSIYDEKAEMFNTPFFQQNDAIAIRSFNDLAADPQSLIYRHPEDYKLYEIGAFEDNNGLIVPIDPPRFIQNAQLNLHLEDDNAPTRPTNSTGTTADP